MQPHVHSDGMTLHGVIQTDGGRYLRVTAERRSNHGRRVIGGMLVTSATEVAAPSCKKCPLAPAAEAVA